MHMQLPYPHFPPIWREGRIGLEWAVLRSSDVLRGAGVPDGDGRGVVLLPGFMAGDGSLAVMAHWLRNAGYRTKSTGIRANVDCSGAACHRIEERLDALAETTGTRVTLIGQSRGGVLARALAAQRPDVVAGVITLGAPLRSQLAVHPLVLAQVGIVGALGTGRMPGMFSLRCLRGACCTDFRAAVSGPFPADVGFVSLYSRSDGVVDWRSCLDPAADCVEVTASHCGMSLNVGAYHAVARALRSFAAREDGLAQAA